MPERLYSDNRLAEVVVAVVEVAVVAWRWDRLFALYNLMQKVHLRFLTDPNAILVLTQLGLLERVSRVVGPHFWAI